MHGLSITSKGLSIRNVVCLERRIIVYQKNFDNRLTPRCLYYSSSHYKSHQRNNSHGNINQSIYHKTWLPSSIIGRRSSSLLQANRNGKPMYQSLRNYGDTAVDFGQNVPLARYEGFLKILVDSPPISFCQNSLISLHTTTGLPWWAIVILVTCTARTLVTLPFCLYQHYIFAKVANLKYEMDEIVKELKMETNRAVDLFGWTESHARRQYNRSLKKQWDQLIIRDNCHPMKGFILMLVQLPMWITISGGFRNLCFMLPSPTPVAQETFMQLSVEGFGWVTNLTAVDSYWILPVSLGVINLVNLEIQYMLRAKESSRAQKIGLNIFRGISLIMVPLAGVVPSCMSLYWVTSSSYGILQSLIVVSPRVRRFARIPETEVELEHPYRHLYDKIKKRISR